MKNLLLLIVGVCILVALFGDGGLEISPNLSPEMQAQLEFSPNVSYAPQTTNVETQANTYIDTNVEQQTVIVQPAAQHMNTGGVTVVDIPANEQVPCVAGPGEIVERSGGPGVCFIVDAAGNRWFQNPRGSRWPVCKGPDPFNCEPIKPLPERISEEPTNLVTLLPVATPLAAAPAELSLEQLQAAFLRNGGELPWLWDARNERAKVDWLKEQAATWR